MKSSIGILAERIASLNKKFRDDAMKGRSIIKIYFCQVNEVLHMTWGIISEKAKLNGPQ